MRRIRWAGVVLLVGAAGMAACTPVKPSSPPPPISVTFECTQGLQTWTVPPGVTQATFAVVGAQGGNGQPNGAAIGVGGAGGGVVGTLGVTPGETFEIRVGCRGIGGDVGPPFTGGAGGFNGGGSGRGGTGGLTASGGGGGASDVRRAGAPLAGRLLIGGGGGGGGGSFPGAAGGAGGIGAFPAGDSGGANVSGFGTGGSQTQGGNLGGSEGTGGDGSTAIAQRGAGGGGGRFGGGGGMANAVAGSAPTFFDGVREGHGVVVITYPA
jgi:hypothetical protein